MQVQSSRKLFTKVPLRLILIIPFVIQVSLIVGLVGYLSYRNGQQAVNSVAHQLRSEITARIEDHLHSFLAAPHQINQINADAISENMPSAADPAALERHLWQQIQVFDTVTSVYFGNTAGGLVDAGREGPQGSLYVITTDGFQSGPFKKYATDSSGNRTELLTTVPDFDARTRAWYTEAAAKGDATWSDIYILFTGQDMALSASRPVYDEQQNLLGVAANDIFLSHIGAFLKHLAIGQTGSSFIMERSGLLVASSTDEKPFTTPDGNKTPERLYATKSSIPAIHYAAAFLTEEFGSYDNINGGQQIDFDIDGQRQFLQVTPVQDEYGIDWLVVVIIPESDFMAQIDAGNRMTIFLVGLSLLFAIVVGVIIARRINRPISHLNASTQALAQGNWDHPINKTRISEIGELAASFNNMVAQLKQTLENLMAEINERKRVESALRESEERFRTLVEDALEGILVHINTKALFVNPACARILGYESSDEILALESIVSIIAPHEKERLLSYHAARVKGEFAPSQYEYQAVRKDGSMITLQQLVTTIPWNGETAVLIVIVDITKRKQAEEALRQSKQLLENTLTKLKDTQEQMLHQERLATVGQLAAGIAHDFNNILAAIVLYTEMSLRSQELPSRIQKYLKVIGQQADHATHLIQQILDFSRRAMIEQRPLDIDALLKESVKLLQRTLAGNILVDLSIEPGQYTINADPTRIQQAITNLALNAQNAMPNGGNLHITLNKIIHATINCIDCGQVIGGDWVELTISDNGKGIPPDVLPHIFEPFFTTRAPIGHGLGLAQVYGIVKQHEGHIEVITEVGKGTTFKLYWPALLAATQELEPTLSIQTLQGKGQTILVVEDNTTIRTALADVLEALGYQILSAANGQKALAVCEQHKNEIDLIISDWVMPSMGGLEFMRQLEANYQAIKVVILSGHPLDESAKKVMPKQIVGWLLKPPNLEQLAQAVSQALEEDDQS
ncbi:MAG: response regulator [Ardenticatenaceae bacterium]|nr:response regulator [Ardenticatenaceae bacterium]